MPLNNQQESVFLPASLKDFVRGFAWNHAAKITEYFLLYVFSVIVARTLGPTANGIYATLISISQLLLTFSSVALDLAINRFLPQLSEPKKEEKTAYLVQRLILVKVVLFSVCSLALLLGWDNVQHWFDVQSPPTLYVIFIIVLGFIRALSSSLTSIWITQLKSKIVFFINSCTLALQITTAVIAVENGYGLNAVLLIVLLGSIVSTLAYVVAGRKFIATSTEKILMKPVFSFVGWLWINAIIAYIYGKQGDIAMLSFFSIDKTSIGYYDVASSLSFVPGFLTAAGLGGISLSLFSRLSKENHADVKPFWIQLSSFLTQITLPLYCFLAVNAQTIITLLYSGAYRESVLLVQIFIFARVLARIVGGGENFDALLSLNAERPAVIIGIVGGTINVLLNILLIPTMKMLGAVMATSITILIIDSSTWWLLKKRAGVPLLMQNWIRSLLLGIVPVGAMKFIFSNPNLVELMLSAAFCILVWMLGIFIFFRRSKSSILEIQTK